MGPTKVIIDTDAGLDDALAIFMVLEAYVQNEVELVAITTVTGNTALQNVNRNVLRILETTKNPKCLEVPVYPGAENSLIRNPENHERYHGSDGFGDVTDPPLVSPSLNRLRSTHAAVALVDLVRENKGDIVLLALGPLTNVALAISLWPDFIDKLKDLYVMGGNINGEGNETPAAEFNFCADTEAAALVLERRKKPVKLVPWETCRYKLHITYEERYGLGGMNNDITVRTPVAHLMNRAEEVVFKRRARPSWVCCDQLVAAWFLSENTSGLGIPPVAAQTFSCYAQVEVSGSLTRGQLVLDRDALLKRPPNAVFLTDVNKESCVKFLALAFVGGFRSKLSL